MKPGTRIKHMGILALLALLASGCGVLNLMFDSPPGGAESAITTNPATCALTPADMEGPYYIPDAPFREQLYPEGTPGTPLAITGTVYNANCIPLAGAVIDIWQADAAGEYDFSDQFIGRARVTTDKTGRYVFLTILPGQYEPRPPHIHLKISHPDVGTLITQLYFAGNNNQGQRGNVIALEAGSGVMRGTFDITLGTP